MMSTTPGSGQAPKANRWLLTGTAAVVLIGGSVFALTHFFKTPAEKALVTAPAPIRSLSALGYLKPLTEVITISVPTMGDSTRVRQLLVKEGDVVKTGQVLAILDNQDRLHAALDQAQGQLQVAQATLAQVKAGAKLGEINAQKATITRIAAESQNQIQAQVATVARLQAERQNAQVDLNRYDDLFNQGAISASQRDRYGLAVVTAQKQLDEASANLARLQSVQAPQLNEAQATLNRISEVRPVDVQLAAADVVVKEAVVRQAQANLDLASVKALQSGRILKIYTRPGEIVGTNGILEMGQTQQMAVVAEVYESDIRKVRVGQAVKVYADSLATPLVGTIERIGLKVQRQSVINSDPSANIDARVVEVWVKLDPASTQKVTDLTYLQVTAEIAL